MNGKICSGHADIDSAINALTETLSAGKNGVKCAVVAYSIDANEFVREHNVCGHVLAKKDYDGSYCLWTFCGTNTFWGHYWNCTEKEALAELERIAYEKREIFYH